MQPVLHMIAMLPAIAASCLISAIWQGMVLAACVTLCFHLLPETTAAIRSFIWTAVFALVIALHIVATPANRSLALQSGHGPALHLDFRWSIAIASVWALLTLVRGSQLVASAIHLRRIARNATPFHAAACTSILDSAHRSAELCASADVESPSVIGFISPRILIPTALLEKLSRSQLEQIVLHEIEHLRRGDDWINLLQKLSLVLFPLNPVLRWIERRLCIERELACDESVLRFTQAPKAYATCLTNLAEHSMQQRKPSLALRAWERQSELASRVHRILRRPNVAMARVPANIMASFLVLAVLGGAAALSHCPRFVSFVPSSISVNAAAAPQAGPPSPFQDAVFHPGSAHPTLVNVEVQKRRPAQRAASKLQRRPKEKRRDRRPAVLSSWFLVTDWNGYSVPAHVSFAVVETLRPSADSAERPAVGWVVFQL